MPCRSTTAALALAALTLTARAWAQEPPDRAAIEAQEPGSGSFVDKAGDFARKHQIIERLNGDVDGWYPRLSGMTTGSGLALGPGYRTHVFDDHVLLDVSAAISTKAYKAVDANARWLQAFGDRLELWTDYRYQNFPQEDFFGLGVDTTLALRTNYALTSHDISARGLFNARPWLRVGLNLGYFMPTIGRGRDRNYRSTELVFNDAEAPGLFEQPEFLHSTVFGEVDYRDVKGNPRSGGFYRVAFGVWDDTTLDRYDHHRFDGEAAHFIPVSTTKHVIANRVGFSYVNNSTGQRVPFYVLPYVGGHDTVRGYKEFRFKEENALWINTEYRYAALKYVDLALFFDAGEVQPDWEDIDFGGLRTAYGFGFRFGTAKRVFARLDIGMGGGEGRQIFFKMGPSF
jgi:outer membrane protein assembly factor BamA